MKNEEIVKLRVIATMLVVIGHSIIIYDPSWNIFNTKNSSDLFYYLKQFINIIQMPMFMSISGYLFFYTLEKDKYPDIWALIKDKYKRLIIPFIFISIFWVIPIRFFVDYKPFTDIGYLKSMYLVFTGIDSGHLWFLPTLFIIFIILYVIKNKTRIDDITILIIFIATYFISFKLKNKFFVNSICRYLIYFYSGYVFAKNEKKIKINKIFYLFFIIFISTSILSVFIVNNSIGDAILNLLAAITGIYFIYRLCEQIRLNNYIEYIDNNSFIIYLFHSPVMYIIYKYYANIHPFILVTMNIFVSISISILVGLILKKLKLFFVMGESKLV